MALDLLEKEIGIPVMDGEEDMDEAGGEDEEDDKETDGDAEDEEA